MDWSKWFNPIPEHQKWFVVPVIFLLCGICAGLATLVYPDAARPLLVVCFGFAALALGWFAWELFVAKLAKYLAVAGIGLGLIVAAALVLRSPIDDAGEGMVMAEALAIETAPPPQGPGVNHLPGDGSVFNRIHQMAVHRGYRIASSGTILRLTLKNEGKTKWSTYKIVLKVHYEMRAAVDWWDIVDHIDQDVQISNCQFANPGVPLACDGTQLEPGASYNMTFVNSSAAYAVIEFPNRIEVEAPGSESPKSVKLNVSGSDMFMPTKIHQVILRPFRLPTEPT